jgi:hypothetical protein
MGFLAKEIFGILGSQIETKLVFCLVGVLIALRHCHLQVENMDHIINLVNNWLDDLCVNCKPNLDFKQYLKVKVFGKGELQFN